MSSPHDVPAALPLGALLPGSSEGGNLAGSSSSISRPLVSPAYRPALLFSATTNADTTRPSLLKSSLGDRRSDEAVSLASHSTVSSAPSAALELSAGSPAFTGDLKSQLLSLSHPLLSCLPLEHTIVADRRRAFHKTQLCRHLASGYCRNGLNCPFAHSEEELRPPPHLSKTMMCPAIKAGEICPRILEGGSCTFAHSRQELRRTANHYKTNMCRSWLSGNCLKNERCTHAHGEVELLLYRHRALQLGRRDFFDEREAARTGNLSTWSGRQTPRCLINSAGTGERARGGLMNVHNKQQQQRTQSSTISAGGPPLGALSRGGAAGTRPRQRGRSSSKRSMQQPEKLPIVESPSSPGVPAETAILLQLAAQLQAMTVSQTNGEGAP